MWKFYIGMSIGSIIILVSFILLFVFWLKSKSHRKKIKEIGLSAENKINGDIKVWARHTKNLFIPSALFAYGTNKVFEVDSILLTSKALIVIEIKSIKGDIIGDASSMKWEKKLADKSFDITNPVLQNEKHIEHIVKMSNIKIPTISLIVFSNRTFSLKVINLPLHAIVIKHAELFDTLDKINSSLKDVLSEYEKKSIFSIIKKSRTNSAKDKLLHKQITQQGSK